VTVAFTDEAGFYLLPSVVRTWALVGETPVLAVPTKYEHLSVASAVTTGGALVTQVEESSFDGVRIVSFLERLLREIPGKITLLWDGARIHSSQVVKDFLSSGAAKRLHLIRLPAYSLELNPDEGVWHWLTRCLGNVCSQNLSDLGGALQERSARLRRAPTSCYRSFEWLVYKPNDRSIGRFLNRFPYKRCA